MSTSSRHFHILVVEDEPTNALVAEAICQRAGYTTEVADNGWQALERLEARAFDLVLTDMQMPGLDGLGLVERIRADARWRTLPIIAVTAKAWAADRRSMLEAGVDLVITKPYHNAELREAIATALGRAGS